MQLVKGSISVWPGYVAAVASLVLSLLLLAGVLVVAITQVGRVVDEYNNQLIVAAIEDERRAMEVDVPQLNTRGAEALWPSDAQRQPSSPIALQSAPMRPASTFESGQQQLTELQELEGRLNQRSDDMQRLRIELGRVREDLRQGAGNKLQAPVVRYYRFVFGPGVQGLDSAVLEQLQRRMQADGVAPNAMAWVLEAGVANLDPVASREVYRLMLNTRSQLVDVGFIGDQVSISLNSSIAPNALPGGRDTLRPGELPMLLKPLDSSAVLR